MLGVYVYTQISQENHYRYLGELSLSLYLLRFDRETNRMILMVPTLDHDVFFVSYIFDSKGIHQLEQREFKSNEEAQREDKMMKSWRASTDSSLLMAPIKDIRASLEKTQNEEKILWRTYFAKDPRLRGVEILRGKVISSSAKYDRFGLYKE